ncbi:SGNH/GDSL hydrolase family protein [Pseudomonas sp. NY15436]|uniref:SGNH/GDSL hydrolase family protein n=1 Tax=Pseudomonas sp. NY15436 TaxID=3400359 RepID=UPI003A8BF834
MRKYVLATLALLLPIAASCADKVLIIGDSISIGYTPFVQETLRGIADVEHSPGNAQDSHNGVQNLDNWIGRERWDVITFNFGLWDICYRLPGPISPENRDKQRGKQAVPLEQYKENLQAISKRLKESGAKVIFVTTTYVPDHEPGRFPRDVAAYNAAAKQIMQNEGIGVIDLNKTSHALPKSFYESDTDVHYTADGYRALAETVTQGIRKALN